MVAIDTDTGLELSAADAEAAANNPSIWTWVEWKES